MALRIAFFGLVVGVCLIWAMNGVSPCPLLVLIHHLALLSEMLTVSYTQEDLICLCSPLPREKEDYRSQVSFKDSDLSTDHSAQVLAYKNLTIKLTVIIIIIITSEMYLTNRCPLMAKDFLFALRNGGTVPTL